MSTSVTIPDVNALGLKRYLDWVYKIPSLSLEDEQNLTKRYLETEDQDAAAILVTSHLKMVAKISMGYRSYDIPIIDLISEGVVGLMLSLKKFDPSKGFRFSTYARWWVKASIQEYILKHWSLVKITGGKVQKKLFFNLRKLKNKLGIFDEHYLSQNSIGVLSKTLDVSEQDLLSMNSRIGIGSDLSLNVKPKSFGDDYSVDQIDMLEDYSLPTEDDILDRIDKETKIDRVREAMDVLSERERYTIEAYYLNEEPVVLDDLARDFGVSRERARQIREAALKKIKREMSKEYAL